MYELRFNAEFSKEFDKLDKAIQIRIYKSIQKLKEPTTRRHLRQGTPYFVEESGQYRILYQLDKQNKIIELLFVGKHKDYENFYKQFF